MNPGYVLPILFLCTLLQSCNGGVNGRMKIQQLEAENFELEAQLKLLNKSAAITIQDGYGDIYDCVDFYKQPAFDHPSLQKYTVNFEQVKYNKRSYDNSRKYYPAENLIDIELKDGGCPEGTVPIRRINGDGSTRQSLIAAGDKPDVRFAVLRTKDSPKRYAGAGGIVTVYEPRVSGRQYSSARFLLKNGPESIEVGWRVDPVLFGDDKCHLSLRTTLKDSGCVGVRCPGFVITAKNVGLEAAFRNVSVRGKYAHELELSIHRESSGDWVLMYRNKVKIGYWPKKIFANEGLAQLASYVEWGGEVYGPNGTPKPPMGSSYYPMRDVLLDCIYYRMTVVDESGQVRDVNDVEPFIKKYGGYLVNDAGFSVRNAGHLMYFGGPGPWKSS